MPTHKEAVEAMKIVEQYCNERYCAECVFCPNGFCGWKKIFIADDAKDELEQLESEEK